MCIYVHLVVKDLGLSGGSIGDEGLIQDVEDVLTDLLQLEFDLGTVLLDGRDVLVGTLGLLLLLDGGDDAPRGTAGANDVLVSDGEEVTLVDGKFAAQLGDLLHVGDHLIVTLSLLAEAGEEGLAILHIEKMSVFANNGAIFGERWATGAREKSRRTNLSR